MLGIKEVNVSMHLHRKVFARFGFDRRVEALLLVSVRRFMKALGYALSHSWQRGFAKVESQRRFRFVPNSFVAVNFYSH